MHDITERPPADAPTAESPAMEVIRRWLDLSELERRAFVALAHELALSSDTVERSVVELSDRFQSLAALAQAQMARVEKIIEVANSLDVDHERVSLSAALGSVEDTLQKAIETTLFVSKRAMRMVYALDDISRDVVSAEACAGEIEMINRKARYLALNAAIEATRSGTAGAAFNVIAHEMKLLSHATEATSVKVRARIAAVGEGMRRGTDIMQEIATLDMSETIMAKQRIDALVAGIVAQNRNFGTILNEAVTASAEIAGTVGRLITGIQFQDRTKQHVGGVITALTALSAATEAAQRATVAAFPGRFSPAAVDRDRLAEIIGQQTLGFLRERLLAGLLEGGSAADAFKPAQQPADDAGDIELF